MAARIGLLLGVLILITACSVSGKYRSDGPCRGFHKDPQACERAYENSLLVNKINIGQSANEVREIMGREPERREVSSETEAWSYLTDYANQILTVIVFKQSTVVEIRQANASGRRA
ncbi:MAG: hypothetical protein JNM52_06630 [Betaproteobacteria bacterium]|nr:hypothetical protein [Betaproteobacteria bacterium]